MSASRQHPALLYPLAYIAIQRQLLIEGVSDIKELTYPEKIARRITSSGHLIQLRQYHQYINATTLLVDDLPTLYIIAASKGHWPIIQFFLRSFDSVPDLRPILDVAISGGHLSVLKGFHRDLQTSWFFYETDQQEWLVGVLVGSFQLQLLEWYLDEVAMPLPSILAKAGVFHLNLKALELSYQRLPEKTRDNFLTDVRIFLAATIDLKNDVAKLRLEQIHSWLKQV